MESLFLKILNMSLTASYVICFVLIMRLLLKKAPKRYSYYLWAAAGFRLACPVSIPSLFSFFNLNTGRIYPGRLTLNLREVPVYDASNTILPKPATGISAVNEIMEASPLFQQSYTSVNPIQILLYAGMILWLFGIFVLALYSVVSWFRMKRKLKTAVWMKGNIYESDKIITPFILGVFHPMIYLPFGLSDEIKKYVLAHERYHIKRKDHLIKLFSFLLLMVHWFNPLCWLSFVLMSKDMEMSCDEKVLGEMEEGKKSYSMALVSFASNRRFPAASPLAFGESGVKARVKNILNWKRPKKWMTAATLILCVLVIAGCVLNPYQNKDMTIGGLSGPLAARLYYQTEEEALEQAISDAVIRHDSYYDSEKKDIYELFRTESHIVMAKEEIKDQVTGKLAQVKMYLLVNSEEFTYTKVSMENTGGSYIPTIITFDVLEDGSYKEADYWIPRDGSYYVQDIRNAFPQDVAEEVIDNSQDYIEMLIQENYLKAVSYGTEVIGGFGWSPDLEIDNLLNEILRTTKESVHVLDLIDDNPVLYRELKYYSMHTLSYCFDQFLKGEREDLKGCLMSFVCYDIMKSIGNDAVPAPEIEGQNGQEWFLVFCDQARKNWTIYDEDELKLFCPASNLLYEMQKDEGSSYVKAMAVSEELPVGEAWEKHQSERKELSSGKTELCYRTFERTLAREQLGDEPVEITVKICAAYVCDKKKECLLYPAGAYVLETNLTAGEGVSFSHGGYTARIHGSEIRISATGQIEKKGMISGGPKTWEVRIPMSEAGL